MKDLRHDVTDHLADRSRDEAQCLAADILLASIAEFLLALDKLRICVAADRGKFSLASRRKSALIRLL